MKPLFAYFCLLVSLTSAQELNLKVGKLPSGPLNAITDVPGVLVGHKSLIQGADVRTGVTAILPHPGNLYQEKVPAGVFVFNGYGKMAGISQIQELGNIETPIVLTNTLSVGCAMTAVVKHTLNQPGNEKAVSVNAVVGETNDSFLNDIRGMHVKEEHVLEAIQSAKGGAVDQGAVGAGVGTRAFGFKGGIGTASRIAKLSPERSYVVGVLVQSNFGGTLKLFGKSYHSNQSAKQKGGSCMIVIATNAPLSSRNLIRLAKRAFNGMARTCTVMTNGSGDYGIAFSTAYKIPQHNPSPKLIANQMMNPLFLAVEEGVQEAIYQSLYHAVSMKGFKNRRVKAFLER